MSGAGRFDASRERTDADLVLIAVRPHEPRRVDAHGRKLDVVRIPSPGIVLDEDGDAVAASHMNFLIGNSVVVVPTYSASAQAAVDALKPLFPGRKIIGLPSRAILTGGGSFHCITQQEPS